MPEKRYIKTLKPSKKAKSARKSSVNTSKSSVKSNNQESSLLSSVSIQNKNEQNYTKNSLQQSESKHKSTSKARVTWNFKSQMNSRGIQNNLEIDENFAVHFGNHHSLNEKKSPNEIRKSLRDPRFSAFSHNKTQFTRQMVQKLESSVGKPHYAKEVSALLEETVEPPNFKISLPPPENCIPNGKSEASYPLWYRDPELLFSKSQEDDSLNEKYGKLSSYLSKHKSKNRQEYEKVLKKEKEENDSSLESLEGESDSAEEGSSWTQEKEASNSNLTSGCSSVTGTMESASDYEDDDDSASSLFSADNEYWSQGVNVPVVTRQ